MLIFDTEANDLLDNATKIYIFGWTADGENVYTSTDPKEFLEALDQHDMAGAHNCYRYDFPLMEKLLGYKYAGLKVDTLWLSWYLFPKRSKHGLDDWGNELGIQKVKVDKDQWAEGDYELMKARVTEDVKINWRLWEKQERLLYELYA